MPSTKTSGLKQIQHYKCMLNKHQTSLVISLMDKQYPKIQNKYTKEYEEFLKIPDSERLAYSKKIYSIPMENTDLILPGCNPTYYHKLPVEPQLSLTLYVWESKHKPKNIVFINHGLNGNIMGFEHLAKYISQNTPTVVIGHDARHFGRSDGIPRGIVNSMDKLCSDLQSVVEWGTGKYGQNLNVFLFGLSMGGRVVTDVVVRKRFPYKGAILVAPALSYNVMTAIPLGLKEYVKMAFLPESGICLPSYTKSCRHKDFVDTKLKPDVYIYQGSLRAGTLKNLGRHVRESKKAVKDFDIPYLFVQPGVDKIVDPFQIRDFQKWVKSTDCTNYFSSQMWHSTCFDQEFLQMTPEICRWIETRST